MRIFISAGEPSGDLHGANLVASLRRRLPDAEFVGFGGPHMRAAGVRLLYPLTELAVMWFGRVLLNIRTFFRLADEADAYFRDERPDAVILIDYPGFHWALAKRAKTRGLTVHYYVPPQIWAWAGWRVEKVRKWVDHLYCSLPFEPAWYEARGIEGATYVGHPYFDELAERHVDTAIVDGLEAPGGPLVAILPGSRTQEVRRNLPVMLRAAAKLAAGRPGVRFAVACLHDRHKALASAILRQSGLDLPTLGLHSAQTPEIIRTANVAWAVSGSVGLELMVEALPTVVLYTVGRLDLIVSRRFIKSKYISLVNLLADDAVMPEYLADRDVSTELAGWAETWLGDPAVRAAASARLAELRGRVAVPGASDRAAGRIAGTLIGSVPAPHRRDRSAAGRPSPAR